MHRFPPSGLEISSVEDSSPDEDTERSRAESLERLTPDKKAKRAKPCGQSVELRDPEVERIDELQAELETKFAANSIEKKKLMKCEIPERRPSIWRRALRGTRMAFLVCSCIPVSRRRA